MLSTRKSVFINKYIYIYINLRVVSFYYAIKYLLEIMFIFIINCKVTILK